jgi:galactose mutarotase-like enzyme
MPAGVGLHPWFIGRPEVAIRADEVYTTNSASPPLPRPVSGAWDLRQLGEMEIGLDATWANVGQPAVSLDWRDLGVRATMTSDAATLHITAANPSEFAAIAIEPQTHAPHGLRRLLAGQPGALTWLEPGDVLSHTIEMSFESYGG